MKKYILCFVMIAAFFVPSALMGGEKYNFLFSYGDIVSFNYKTGTKYSNNIKTPGSHYKTDYACAIDLQYFIFKNISFGAIISYNTLNDKALKLTLSSNGYYEGKNKESLALSYGPVITWHYFAGDFIPFFSFSNLYTHNSVSGTTESFFNDKDNSAPYKYTSSIISFNFQVGTTYLLTRNIGLYIAYRYTLQHEKITSAKYTSNSPDSVIIFMIDIRNQAYLSHDTGITLGFRFFF